MAATRSDEALYPPEYEADVELSDGGTAFTRPVRPEDGPALEAFHSRQSPESIYYRFFSPHPTLSDAEVEHFVTVDYQDRFALVAFVGDELIGVVRYDRPEASQTAEVAFFIDDAHHGRGLATILLEHIAEAARDRGIEGFWATVLPDNRRMVGVFRRAGFGVTSRFSDGLIEVELNLEPTEEARSAIEERARRAQQQAVRRLLEPRHVVVIGASTGHDGLGRRSLDSILDHGFRGTVSVVHPTASSISGVPAHASILDIDEEVDLALVAVPSAAVVEVVDECGRAGVAGVIVISSGFAESSEQGSALEAQLLGVVRRYGMRLLGPNCMGLINTDPEVALHATFVDVPVREGGTAIMSQSGTMGGAILEQANRVGLGVSSFVSVGNKADVSGNDMLTFWGDDPRTDVVLMYLESFGNPRRFARIAKQVSESTPILAIKSGRHRLDRETGIDDATVDTLLARQGVVRVDGVSRLLDVARLISFQGVPRGGRLGVVSNSRAAVRLVEDTAFATGLDVVDTRDLGWDATVDDHLSWLRRVFEAGDCDQLLIVFAPTDRQSTDELYDGLLQLAAENVGTPLLVSVFGPHDPVIGNDEVCIPVFDFPDDAVVAASHSATYGRWRSESSDAEPIEVEFDTMALREMAASAVNGDSTMLDTEASASLLQAAGLKVAEFHVVSNSAEAARAAREIEGPVALKVAWLDGPARREAEGASLDLHDPEEVAASFERMRAIFGDAMDHAVVQRMVDVGRDLTVEVTLAPNLGPVLTVEAQNGHVERTLLPLVSDVVDRLIPAEITGADRKAVADLLAHLAALAEHVPEVRHVRLTPVIVCGGEALITNARIDLTPDRVPDEPALRRL